MRLQGRAALITGAASGIGRAVTELFAKEGATVWDSAAVAGAHSYHAAKGAVRNMSKNAAVTYVADGIRVNSVHPGFIDTPLTPAQAKDLNDAVIDATPMKRAGKPAEIAYGCLFLACDESSYVTGVELVIDGGYLAQ